MFFDRSPLMTMFFVGCFLLAGCQPEQPASSPNIVPSLSEPTRVAAVAPSGSCGITGLSPEECTNAGTNSYQVACRIVECAEFASCSCTSEPGVHSAQYGPVSMMFSFSGADVLTIDSPFDETTPHLQRVSPNTWAATYTDANPLFTDSVTVNFTDNGARLSAQHVRNSGGARISEERVYTRAGLTSPGPAGVAGLQPDFSDPRVEEISAQLTPEERAQWESVAAQLQARLSSADFGRVLDILATAPSVAQCTLDAVQYYQGFPPPAMAEDCSDMVIGLQELLDKAKNQ